MRVRHKTPTLVSMWMLDVFCCALGCVTLLWLLNTRQAGDQTEAAKSALTDLERVRSNGYAFQIEMTYRLWRKGMRIRELPIIFADRTLGESKMSKRISVEAFWIVWWLKLRDLRGKL